MITLLNTVMPLETLLLLSMMLLAFTTKQSKEVLSQYVPQKQSKMNMVVLLLLQY
jgi:hypothetical protein